MANSYNKSIKSQRERKNFSVNSFGGVDYLNNPLLVANNHAVDMSNFLKINGINQKRYGYEPIMSFKYHNFQIKNVFKFVSLDKLEHTIVILKKGYIYEIDETNNISIIENSIFRGAITGVNTDDDLNYVINNGKVYYFTKEGLQVIYFSEDGYCEVEPIEHNAYVPTISINMQYSDNDINRRAFEDVNLLTPLVKITGITHSHSEKYYQEGNNDYISDSFNLPLSFDYKDIQKKGLTNELDIFNTFFSFTNIDNFDDEEYEEYIFNSNLYNELKINNFLGKLVINGKTYTPKIKNINGGFIPSGYENKISYLFPKGDYETTIKGSDDYYCIVYVDDNDNVIATLDDDTLILNDDIVVEQKFINQNIEFTYPHYVEGNLEKIKNCSFGHIYNAQNNPTLFVSGNPNFPNMDWHSNGNDFTYFSDLSYCAYGSSTSKLMGYVTLNDGSLCALKETKDREPTIYFRNAVLTEAIDYVGNKIVDQNGNPLPEINFPLTVGSIGKGLVNANSLMNYGNEAVFLSEDGLYAIVTSQNTSTNIKFSQERSKFISPVLKKLDLSKCATCVFDNRYYISDIEKNRIYVADNRYLSAINEDNSEIQYEWWVLDNIKANNFFAYKDELMFVSDNVLYKFRKEPFYSDYKVFRDFLRIMVSSNNNLVISNHDNTPVNTILANDQSGEYILKIANSNKLIDVDNVEYVEFKIKPTLHDEELEYEAYEIRSGAKIEVASLTYINDVCECVLLEKIPIVSTYLTKPFNFGTNLYSKYIYNYALVQETDDESICNIGVNYRDDFKVNFEGITHLKHENQPWFDKFINWEIFSFTNHTFARVFTCRKKIRNINSLQFIFTNTEDTNCVINGLSIEYTYGFKNRGDV